MGRRKLLESRMEGGLFLYYAAVSWRMGDIWTREDTRGGEQTGEGSPSIVVAQRWIQSCAASMSCSVWLENNSVISCIVSLLPPFLPTSLLPPFLLALPRAWPCIEHIQHLSIGCPYKCQEVDPDPLSCGFKLGPTRMPEPRRMKAWVEPTTQRLWRACILHTAISI